MTRARPSIVGLRSAKAEPGPRGPALPWFKFIVEDWLFSDTIDAMTNEQAGAYVFLLARQWRSRTGVLPKDDATLAKWSRLGARWRAVGRPILKTCFVERADGFVNVKLWKLWGEAVEQRASAKRAAAARWEGEN